MSRPNASVQMTTACLLLEPVIGPKVNGVPTKYWPTDVGKIFFANLKSYGGTERVANDLWIIEDTMTLTCWYRPDITSACRVKIMQTGATYEIIGEPENWEMRNQFLVCKLKRVKGNG